MQFPGDVNVDADVPLIATDPAGVVDNGDTINGVPWISRTPSGIDTVYPPDMTVAWRVIEPISRTYPRSPQS